MTGGWVYIVTNRKHGTLYVGVTSDIRRRAVEHREGAFDSFTKKHALHRLVWMEPHETMPEAIRREKSLKRWQRAWKIQLIEQRNPDWDDLFETLNS
ncbi:GIY-YIG nuclease family protein [Rhodobium gokarnense]|uniref:Endonuclease n=1 Tax=Rhodobium gokarnense TaxID=364296 RepID=A0ABT3HHP5_9HYPH|nr:GIY-YIG nuclease family protein [Rhodobium gokarnense]MCW2309781.1 putative endonuclease [Rhodobium gokarnense]